MTAYLGTETRNFSGIGNIIAGKFTSSGAAIKIFEYTPYPIVTVDFFIESAASSDWLGLVTSPAYTNPYPDHIAIGFAWDNN